MDEEYIHSEYFYYNGQKYYIGTKFKIKYKDKIVSAYFSSKNNIDKNMINIIIIDGLKNTTLIERSEKDLCNMIVEITPINLYENLLSQKKYINDLNIPEVTIGWFFYIFSMGIISIFNEREYAWILLTILFFIWRHNTKQRCGVYYDKRR